MLLNLFISKKAECTTINLLSQKGFQIQMTVWVWLQSPGQKMWDSIPKTAQTCEWSFAEPLHNANVSAGCVTADRLKEAS